MFTKKIMKVVARIFEQTVVSFSAAGPISAAYIDATGSADRKRGGNRH